MAYTKDYYDILGLRAPTPGSSYEIPSAEVRRAYKLALLATHPDKNTTSPSGHSVDQVKEAYTILSDSQCRAEYNNFLLRNPHMVSSSSQKLQQQPPALLHDFVLGLELLDLSDFDVLDPGFAFSNPPEGEALGQESEAEGDQQQQQMEWSRACRCGAGKGFKILEEELEDAEERGEKEVLVGCEGCSLWVRVGFEVEVG
ncbi:diphthamide biosynthesis protein 4 [Phaeosphaeriaceae sp. PMI808]|nr:diphthamide biosynthesis protein 4 [Phaeosphaeriaceae sp. PMI808]